MKDDAISRKAVIDFITDIERRALDKSLKISNGNSDEVMKTVMATAKAIRGYCEIAPPAQQSFEWCHDCKEYDQAQHCCHRWTKAIRKTVDELKQSAQQGKWEPCYITTPTGGQHCVWECDGCGARVAERTKYCAECGRRMTE